MQRALAVIRPRIFVVFLVIMDIVPGGPRLEDC